MIGNMDNKNPLISLISDHASG